MTTYVDDDRTYSRFIRTLYVVAIAVNLWYIKELAEETDEGRAAVNRMKWQISKAKSKASGVFSLWHTRTFFRQHADDVIREAEEIITEDQ